MTDNDTLFFTSTTALGRTRLGDVLEAAERLRSVLGGLPFDEIAVNPADYAEMLRGSTPVEAALGRTSYGLKVRSDPNVPPGRYVKYLRGSIVWGR